MTILITKRLNLPILLAIASTLCASLATAADTMDVLDLQQVEVTDVLKILSKKSGRNIVANKNVRGPVTIYLEDVSVEEALRMIAVTNGWASVEEGQAVRLITSGEYEQKFGRPFGQDIESRGYQLRYAKPAPLLVTLNEMKSPTGKIILQEGTSTFIMTDERSSLERMEKMLRDVDIPTQTRVFQLNYARAETIAEDVYGILAPATVELTVDERMNRLIVHGTVKNLERIADLLKALDQKDQEVLIEAKIVQVVLSDEFKMGVDWEAVLRDSHELKFKNEFDVLGAGSKKGKVTIGTLDRDDYRAAIEALENSGSTDILSSPRITALNQKEAKILVGSTEPYVTTTTTTPASGPTTVAENVKFIEVGVKLFATPTIHHDGFITMKIKPEVSSVTSNIVTSNNNTIPIVETSEAETTVTVKNGVTIVIGGLIKEETIKSLSRVPLLGKIPLLGMVFGNRSDVKRKTEIVIFLTPTIISGDLEI